MIGPSLVVSDGHGAIMDVPTHELVGLAIRKPYRISPWELIPLPEGSDLFTMPSRIPLGFNAITGDLEEVTTLDGLPVTAVAAFMAPAHLQRYRAAYHRVSGAPTLPLYAYTAVGWWKGGFHVAATRIDRDIRQDARYVDCDRIEREARRMLKRYPKNRLVQHLVDNCVRRYGCPAARNFAMGRWEFPIPVSSGCNARCVGCLSHQEEGTGVISPMERISFTPTVEEIVEYTVPHLAAGKRAVVSFGQGCEGEPLIQADLIESAIGEIRKRTTRGIINLNTNAWNPQAVERLCVAGLDSIRVSINSFQEPFYNAYFRPRGYRLSDVLESIAVASRFRRWVSINYFMFPGLTDSRCEIDLFKNVMSASHISMIQTRNLNMDPDVYIDLLSLDENEDDAVGIGSWIEMMRKQHPTIRLGYFNPPREVMESSTKQSERPQKSESNLKMKKPEKKNNWSA